MNFQSQLALLASSPGSGLGSGFGSSGVRSRGSVLGPPGGVLALTCGSGSGPMPVVSHSGSGLAAPTGAPVLSNSAVICAETQRFYAIYGLIERVEDVGLQKQI